LNGLENLEKSSSITPAMARAFYLKEAARKMSMGRLIQPYEGDWESNRSPYDVYDPETRTYGGGLDLNDYSDVLGSYATGDSGVHDALIENPGFADLRKPENYAGLINQPYALFNQLAQAKPGTYDNLDWSNPELVQKAVVPNVNGTFDINTKLLAQQGQAPAAQGQAPAAQGQAPAAQGQTSPASPAKGTGFTFTPEQGTYGVGDTGNQVEQIQKHLIDTGYMSQGAADGSFGKNTENALRKFQQDKGLSTDGTFGAQTLRAFQGQQGEKTAPNVNPGNLTIASLFAAAKPETGDSTEGRESLPKGDESALGGPSPKIDKKKWKPNATNPDGNLKPIKTEGDNSPHPTRNMDIKDKPDYQEDTFDTVKKYDNNIWKREQLPTAKGDEAGFEGTRNIDQPTKAAETFPNKNQANPVTNISLPQALAEKQSAMWDPGRPGRMILDALAN
jgi:peptidoglycan hydrolase-like protein with peptidoglycan-binding domain